MKAAGAATAAAGNDEWISNKEAPDPEVLPHLPGYHILIRPVAIREKTKGGILLPDKFKDDVKYLTTLGRVLKVGELAYACLLYTSPSPRDVEESRMPSSA